MLVLGFGLVCGVGKLLMHSWINMTLKAELEYESVKKHFRPCTLDFATHFTSDLSYANFEKILQAKKKNYKCLRNCSTVDMCNSRNKT